VRATLTLFVTILFVPVGAFTDDPKLHQGWLLTGRPHTHDPESMDSFL
jgi:hypothetical protein